MPANSFNSTHKSTIPFRWPSLDTHHVWLFRLNDTIPHTLLEHEAMLIAKHHGMQLGPSLVHLPRYFWAYKQKASILEQNEPLLLNDPHPSISYHERQVLRQTLFKRTILPPTSVNKILEQLEIRDPQFNQQWHLYNSHRPIADINVTEVWKNGVTGQGITVAIVDDGIDSNALDLKGKINYESSYDFNDHQQRPDPKLDDDHHGTRCAGEVAAARNSVCGVGVAYNARLSGIRILSGKLLVGDEASAYVHGLNINDIYSCSFGPDDHGFTLQGPALAVEEAFKIGVTQGRQGKGALYVFASGNGGMSGDNCNADGYANSIYTITIGALTDRETRPYYSEPCAAQLSVVYSGGGDHYGIFTTDNGVSKCTAEHSGTSAAAPLGAGILALVLSANPNLTYRTVMHLLVETSIPFGLENKDNDWYYNVITKKYFSHYFGFGKMDSYRLVEAAKNRTNVGDVMEFSIPLHKINKPIELNFKDTVEIPFLKDMKTLEHVCVTITLVHPRRGDVEIDLISPNQIISHLMTKRSNDDSSEGYNQWTFSTVQHWGEPPAGNWTLVLRDLTNRGTQASFVEWRLLLRGESFNSTGFNPNPLSPTPPSNQVQPPVYLIASLILVFTLFILFSLLLYIKREVWFWPWWKQYMRTTDEYDVIEMGGQQDDLFYKEKLGTLESEHEEDPESTNNMVNPSPATTAASPLLRSVDGLEDVNIDQ